MIVNVDTRHEAGLAIRKFLGFADFSLILEREDLPSPQTTAIALMANNPEECDIF